MRKLIGMVFQKPNPFPKSIYDNVAFGPRVVGMKQDMDGLVEQALRRAALWDEVKDRLDDNAYRLSGGQQQRLCIARCLAVEPDVLLMDEPCSALDPIATSKIEDLMLELKRHYSIVIVTHNMQQAGRVSDMTAVLMPEVTRQRRDHRPHRRVRRHQQDLHQPREQADRGLRHRPGRMTPEARVSFHENLEGLEQETLSTAELAATAVNQAIEAVVQQDYELAVMVINNDDRIDGRYLDVHQGVLSLLARQSPVASDLRLVAAILHAIMHIERIGDLCVNIAKLVPLMGETPDGGRRDPRADRTRRSACAGPDQAGPAGVRGAAARPGRGPGAPGRRDRPPEPRDLLRRDRDRRRHRRPGVGRPRRR